MNFDFFDWRDLVVIFNIIFFTNIIKYFIRAKNVYIYIPFLFSIIIFFVLFFLKVYSLKECVFIVFKWFAGSIILYETILEKIKKVWDLYDKDNKEVKNGKTKKDI